MKKLLLSLLLILALAIPAVAESITLPLTSSTDKNWSSYPTGGYANAGGKDYTYTDPNTSIAFTLNLTNAYYNGGGLQCKASTAIIKMAAPTGYKLTTVQLNYLKNSTAFTVTAGGKSLGSTSAGKFNVPAENQQALLEFKIGSTYVVLSSIDVTIESLTPVDPDAPVAPNAPTISCEDNVVSIASDETDIEGIYYALGANPTDADYVQYTAPITITKDETVNAYTLRNGLKSKVATYSATYVYICDSFFLLSDLTASTPVKMVGDFTVTAQMGNDTYLVDGEGFYGYIYGAGQPALVNGDHFTTITGKWVTTGGGYINVPVYGEKTNDGPVAPTAKALNATFTTDDYFSYVSFADVTIKGVVNNAPVITKDGVTMTLKNNAGIKLENLIGCTVEGILRHNADGYYLVPTKVTGGVPAFEIAAPVFSIAAGSYFVGQTLELTCATKDATIYYSINDAEYVAYTEPLVLTQKCTVKAYARLLPQEDSKTTSAAYTITVATPTFSLEAGKYSYATELTLTCETEGAKIYYSIDDVDIIEYSQPIVLLENCTVSAYAELAPYTDSPIKTVSYTILPEGLEEVTFDIANATLKEIQTWFGDATLTAGSGSDTPETCGLTGKTMRSGSIKVSFDKDGTNTPSRLFFTTSGYDLRVYKGGEFSLLLSHNNKRIQSITLSGVSQDVTVKIGNADAKGTWDGPTFNFDDVQSDATTAAASTTVDPVVDVKFVCGSKVNQKITGISVVTLPHEGAQTGVESINVDNRVVYYNLQGMPVANPAAGQLLIRRQGNVTTKVVY